MILNHLHFFHHDDDKNYWHNSFLFCAIYNNLQSWLFLQMMLQFPEWIPNRLITLDKFPVYGKLSNVFNLLGNSTRFNTSLLSLELILYKCCFHAREVRERRKGEKAKENVIEVFNCPEGRTTSCRYDTKPFHWQYVWSVGDTASTKPNPM